tara:strand:+ start:13689 stop:19481 length:5793 start_codon:yes stop_codon:yes gene_type:complete
MAYDPVQDFTKRQPVDLSGDRAGMYTDAPASSDLQPGVTFDPVARFKEGIDAGAYNLETNRQYFGALVNSLRGDEEALRNSIHRASISQAASSASKTVDPAEQFHQFLDAPDFKSFTNAAFGFAGEMLPSAAASITAALTGAAIGAVAPVTIPAVAALGSAGKLATAAGATAGKNVALNLARRGSVRELIKKTIEKAAKKEKLTPDEDRVMDLVYQTYRNSVQAKRAKVGGLIGAGSQEYLQGGGTFFGNYAEQGVTDPVAAVKSLGLAVPFAAVGVGAEAALFNAVTNVAKQGTRKALVQEFGKPLAQAKEPVKSNVLRKAIGATALSTVAEGGAEAGQTLIEGFQKFRGGVGGTPLDDKYTISQLKLDTLTAAFAGAAGGFGVGGSGAAVGSTISKAQEMLTNHNEKQAVIDAIQENIDGRPFEVQPESAEQIEDQFIEMMDPTNKKDSVFVEVNSLTEFEKVRQKLQDRFGNRIKQYDISIRTEAGNAGGVLFSTNEQKLESFANVMELNQFSNALLDAQLARALDYSRTRAFDDTHVVEVKNARGNAVHYHQTKGPDTEEGIAHLEAARELFNNNPNYTYEIVDAETHLRERAARVGPEVREMRDDDIDFDETADQVDTFEQGRDVFELTPPRRTDDPVILNRNNQAWTPPNPEFADDQMPSPELINEARGLTQPEFLAEFDDAINNDEYSRILLEAFVNRANKFEERNDDGTLKNYKIEKTEEGYVIGTYDVTPTQAESYSDIARDIARIIRNAKKRKGARQSRFQIIEIDKDGNEGAPIAVDMPFIVNQFRNLVRRTGLQSDTGVGGNLSSLASAFVDFQGTLLTDLDGQFKLQFKFEDITEQSLRDPEAIVYTEGSNTFTLSQLLEGRAQTTEAQTPLNVIEERVQKDFNINPRDLNAVRQKLNEIKQLPESPQTLRNIETLEKLLAEGTFDPSRDLGPETTDPTGGQEGDPIFQEQLPEDYWNAERQAYERQPLNENLKRGRYKAASTGKGKITFSPVIRDIFELNVDFIVTAAKKVLGISKDIKVFSATETIDLGDPKLNEGIKRHQQRILDNENTKGLNVPYADFDVIILGIGANAPLDSQGFYILALGHEIGHTFFREQINKSLSNPKLRKMLMKEYEAAKAANPEIAQWQDPETGFEEWVADKVASFLFNEQAGKLLKATNLAESFIKSIARKLRNFWTSLKLNAEQKSRMANRFAYSETFREYMNGFTNTISNSKEAKDINYDERAHIEDTIDQVYGLKPGEKTFRKINRAAEKIVRTGKVPNWLKKLFYTAHGFLEGFGPVGKELADFFHVVSGNLKDTGMINEANRLTNEYMQKLVKVLKMDNDKKFGERERKIMQEAADESKTNEQLSEEARAVREFLQQMYNDFNLKEYGIEFRKNFFPRIIAIAEIASNSTKRAKLIELLVERNKGKTFSRSTYDDNGNRTGSETFQLTPEEATKMVEGLIGENEDDVNNTTEDERKGNEYNVGALKERAKMFEDLDSVTLLKEGLILPPEVAIVRYIGKSARRSEYEKRGGPKRIEELINQLPEEQRAQAKEAVNAMLGKINPIENDIWRHTNSTIQALNVLTLLGMAVFASIPDAAGPILRTRNFDLKVIGRNLYQAIGDKNEGAELAKSIGVNGVQAAATTILYSGELDSAYDYSKNVSDTWFRVTQLERWTIFTRKFAAGMGRDFLLKHQKIVENGVPGDFKTLQSKRFLKELGLTAEDVKAWDGKNIDNHPKIKTAIARFVDEAIVRPNAAERPIWASDPNFALVWQLKSFYYAYGKNIVGGLFREGETRFGQENRISAAVAPLLFGAALLMPLTMLGWDLRERFKIGLSWLLPGVSPQDTDYRASRSMSSGEYWFEILDRSGALGPYALALPLFMDDKRYGNPFFIPIAGPTAERAWDIVTLDTDFFDFVPAYSQLNTSKFNLREN